MTRVSSERKRKAEAVRSCRERTARCRVERLFSLFFDSLSGFVCRHYLMELYFYTAVPHPQNKHATPPPLSPPLQLAISGGDSNRFFLTCIEKGGGDVLPSLLISPSLHHGPLSLSTAAMEQKDVPQPSVV